MSSATASMTRRLFLASRSVCRRPVSSRFNSLRIRGMASGGHESGKAKSDMPWMLGSGIITVAGAAYLLTPASKAQAHSVAAGSHGLEVAHKPASSEGGAIRGEKFTGGKGQTKESAEPMTDDEGGEASGEDVGASMAQGFKTDSPKDAQNAEESGSSGPPASSSMTDGEGNEENVEASIKKGVKTDGPKDAKASEEDGRFDDGAPGQTDAVHSQGAEQKEKPGSKRSGTMQEEGSDGPTNMGDARAEAKGKNAPKEAAQGDKKKK